MRVAHVTSQKKLSIRKFSHRLNRKTPAPGLAKLPNINDDFPFRKELNLSDDGFQRAVDRASMDNQTNISMFDTHILHSYQDKLETCKKSLVKRILYLSRKHMRGLQLQVFLHSFQFGINKCQTARMMKVSRQCIQIQNRRAVRRLRKLIYQDTVTVQYIAEMQRLRKRIQEFEGNC